MAASQPGAQVFVFWGWEHPQCSSPPLSLAHALCCSTGRLAAHGKGTLICHGTAAVFLPLTPESGVGKQGDVKCCIKAHFWGLNSGKIFIRKMISMCFLHSPPSLSPPVPGPVLFFPSCHGLKRINFLGHFAWDQNKDLQLSPWKGEVRARSRTAQHSTTPGMGCQRAGGQKADGKTKPGTLVGRNWDIAAPAVSDFKSPCLTTDACLGALHFTAAAWGYVFPSKHEQSCSEC